MASFLIDVLLVVMLAGTLSYAIIVHRKLRRLMIILQSLEPLVLQFSAAVDKSEQSVSDMKSATRDVISEAAAEANQSRVVSESLTFKTQRPKPFGNLPRLRDLDVPGATRICGKADLVKSFFESNRGLNSW